VPIPYCCEKVFQPSKQSNAISSAAHSHVHLKCRHWLYTHNSC